MIKWKEQQRLGDAVNVLGQAATALARFGVRLPNVTVELLDPAGAVVSAAVFELDPATGEYSYRTL